MIGVAMAIMVWAVVLLFVIALGVKICRKIFKWMLK